MAENLCLSCGKSDPDSLKILEMYLCGECESRLVKSRTDHADYRHWMASCRKLWENIETKVSEME
jgi:DNA-directed RNA polymerase subunit RPC12/RpoP